MDNGEELAEFYYRALINHREEHDVVCKKNAARELDRYSVGTHLEVLDWPTGA